MRHERRSERPAHEPRAAQDTDRLLLAVLDQVLPVYSSRSVADRARRPLSALPRDRLPALEARLVHGAPLAGAVARRRPQERAHAILKLFAIADAAERLAVTGRLVERGARRLAVVRLRLEARRVVLLVVRRLRRRCWAARRVARCR